MAIYLTAGGLHVLDTPRALTQEPGTVRTDTDACGNNYMRPAKQLAGGRRRRRASRSRRRNRG